MVSGLIGALHFCRQLPKDRKSTRLNSSHDQISYAVFCLKKKNSTREPPYNMPTRHPSNQPNPLTIRHEHAIPPWDQLRKSTVPCPHSFHTDNTRPTISA